VTLEKTRYRRSRSIDLPSDFAELEEMFNKAFELLDVFESSARLEMLLTMYREPCNKSHLRRLVNPKLVYENLAMLQERSLIEELSDGRFDLTEMGKRILRQYMQFLENLRKTMWEV
jgi:predicted transcriptional regulator